MGLIEKAGGSLHAIAKKSASVERPEPVSATDEDVMPPVKKSAGNENAPAFFDLDFESLQRDGFYHPEQIAMPIAKEMRAIKRRLLRRLGYLRVSGERQQFRMPGRQRNLVMVTSTQASEGKTYCALNLALSLALEDRIDVRLVDADIQRPKIRERFGLPSGRGLSDYLRDPERDLAKMWRHARQAPLSVLGEGAPENRPADLFATPAMEQMLTALSAENSDGLVLLDTPPVLATTEAVVLARFVDEIIFVVEANKTAEPAVASALDELLDINPNVNLVLNRCLIGQGSAHFDSYEYYGQSDPADKPENMRVSHA